MGRQAGCEGLTVMHVLSACLVVDGYCSVEQGAGQVHLARQEQAVHGGRVSECGSVGCVLVCGVL